MLRLLNSQPSLLILAILLLSQSYCFSAEIPQTVIKKLQRNKQVDVIVEYDDSEILATKGKQRFSNKRSARKARLEAYLKLKRKVDQSLKSPDIRDIKTYHNLPLALKHFDSIQALQKWSKLRGVKAIYEDRKFYKVLSESLPLINQPQVANSIQAGAGTTVAVIDDGIDYSKAAFGSCTGPNTPASCNVVASIDFASVPNTVNVDHGTNVSATVLGVAPAAKIAMLNVFGPEGFAMGSDIISAIDWAIDNQITYNIVAINLSLGDPEIKYTSACDTSPYRFSALLANLADISVVAASGNEQYTDGIASPACTPEIISIGAVYDADYGQINWSECTDATTGADQVTCFSNSASFLDLLAPGALNTAAGITQGGTSQASPHVAGAIAVLRSLYPDETLIETKARLVDTGVPVVDARNNLVKPRVNLLAAVEPKNNNFVNAISLIGNSGTTITNSIFATKEQQEIDHLDNIGGASLWWKWVASQDGLVTLATDKSDFDTLLAVYQGTDVNNLLEIAANDDDVGKQTSLLQFIAQAGEEYFFVVDGKDGENGMVNFGWNFDTSVNVDLSVSITGPNDVFINQIVNYVLTISNASLIPAPNVVTTLHVPSSATIISTPDNCDVDMNTISCLQSELLANSSVGFSIQLQWVESSADVLLNASVDSDLSESVDANAPFSVNAEIPEAAEVPMPLWALSLMMLSMFGVVLGKQR